MLRAYTAHYICLFQTEQERNQYDIRWRLYFNHLEKWILTPITEETKDSELALWIYRCIGTLILCTSVMLYSKVYIYIYLRVLNFMKRCY